MELRDRFGRVATDLRVSVTDRCNLRCRYCIPHEPAAWFERRELLTFEEIARLVRILASQGVSSVTLTGGEPLLRRGLPDLVRMVVATPGIGDLSLTTNGTRLRELAAPLRAAGLRRATVSLDTLRPERFRAISQRDEHAAVLAGIAAARAAGLAPVKVNAVPLRGVNDDEFVDFAAWSRDTGIPVRFIEYMPLEAGPGEWSLEKVVPGREILAAVGRRFPLVPASGPEDPAPARAYRFADGAPGGIGVIMSVTEPFCRTCTRIRLTSDGKLTTCLYGPDETDLREPLRLGASDEEIAARVREAVLRKRRGGALEVFETRRPIPLVRTMHQIGG
ncbi:MAG: GTP 3',8-cyclase MoaA [Planctomycetales bacterium]|nr:GTP 3',8-cyclase MoaA [Planctomycetales bacterium]